MALYLRLTAAVSVAFSVAVIFICLSITVSSEFPKLKHHPVQGDETLKFLVVGDWGRKGEYNQSRVASQMGRIAEELVIEFVVSTGDNFYDDGLVSEDDPAFLDSFTNIYTAHSLQKPWYNVLGNHDYRGDVLAQLSPSLRKIDTRWLCFRSFVVDAGVAELFFVDTTPFVRKYFTEPTDHTYDWRGVLPVEKYTAQLLRDLESALTRSTSTWKIVIGHHTIRSVSHHGDTQELIDQLLPILRTNNVDFYINGHDHCLQHISDDVSSMQYLTSGGGSKSWRGDFIPVPELKFYYDGQGFMSVEATWIAFEIVFYDVFGSVRHRWSTSKHQVRQFVV